LALHALRPSQALNDLAKYRAFPPDFDNPVPLFQPRTFLEKLKALPNK
jgi:hypothetical protein